MCGIAGIWIDESTERPRGIVANIVDKMTHRGPDDRGIVEVFSDLNGQSVVLGHSRLAVIDLSSAGHQPMLDPDTGNWIVFNGEVYNFKELRADLEARGCRFKSDSDTEVILQSYRVWGTECLQRWRGMFAVAIWDRCEHKLFLGRDRLGIKPLYYYYQNGQFVFASEVKALVASGLMSSEIDLGAVNTYLVFGAVQDPLTLVKNVRSLPPAYTLTVTRSGISLGEYWELPLVCDSQASSYEPRLRRIRDRLEDAVQMRLVSDVPLGIFLSGGIDSTAIATLANQTSSDEIETFTISFTNDEFDETAGAKRTAGRLSVKHHSILLTEDEMLASCRYAVDALDQPSVDGINTFYISRAVRSAGMTVALSGLGGDEAFCGYKHFRFVPRIEKFLTQYGRTPYVLRSLAAATLARRKGDRAAKIRAVLSEELLGLHPFFLARMLFLPELTAQLFERDAMQEIDQSPWVTRTRELTKRAQTLDPINRVSFLDLKTYLPNTLLRDADVMSMAHSLELRVPLLDHVLLEEVMRVPGQMKMNGMSKRLLLDCLGSDLPKEFANNPKRGFTLPFAHWLPGRLRHDVEDAFNHPPSCLEGVINPVTVKSVWRSFLRGECSWTRPWSLYVLYKVARRMFEETSQPSQIPNVIRPVNASAIQSVA